MYAEGCAALAMAVRTERIDHAALRTASRGLERLYEQMYKVEVSDSLVRRAGSLAQTHSLRGDDAVHLAAAEPLVHEEIVVDAGDGPLCRAGASAGLAVARI